MNLAMYLMLSVFPYTLPVGFYSYKGHLVTENLRIAEVVDHTVPAGTERIKELRKDKFNCIRQSQLKTICSKNTGPIETPEEFKPAVAKKLENFTFDFYAPESDPQSYQDVSQTHTYNVFAPVRLGDAKLSWYQFVHYYESGKQALAFPVSEDQPIGNLIWADGELGLTLVVSQKVGVQTYGYILKAYYSN
ncbi:hypothetical protein CIK05_01575 [Bdellovibrio sp. qaytius]|nr:hypothetical protein CIK05_01575 [Bdellovibrio sp. qaytius]